MRFGANQQRFRLQKGLQIGSIGQRSTIEPTEYRVDQDCEYDVYTQDAGGRDVVGTCTIESGPPGYIVAPAFDVMFDPSDCKFLGVWDTDSDGIAHLKHVWMTVEGA